MNLNNIINHKQIKINQMIKNFTNNLEATAYGYAMAVLAYSDTDSDAKIEIVNVSAESDSRVKLIVSYIAGEKIVGGQYRDKDTGHLEHGDVEPVSLTEWHFIDMDSIDLATEWEKLLDFFESLKFDPEFDGTDDTDYR